jgi:hypothetical protein
VPEPAVAIGRAHARAFFCDYESSKHPLKFFLRKVPGTNV